MDDKHLVAETIAATNLLASDRVARENLTEEQRVDLLTGMLAIVREAADDIVSINDHGWSSRGTIAPEAVEGAALAGYGAAMAVWRLFFVRDDKRTGAEGKRSIARRTTHGGAPRTDGMCLENATLTSLNQCRERIADVLHEHRAAHKGHRLIGDTGFELDVGLELWRAREIDRALPGGEW